ncbi:S8 family serine peptidase [Actinoplanes campanulatus]|uniref:S8 family serine peptidase n=1 Tax=Actinoplanes campanulatus TaxID=113559 RepID=UPI0031D95BFB
MAVVDTGVSPTSDLASGRLAPGYDFIDDDTEAVDGDGHGTAIASVLAADHDNNAGASGVCGRCRILPVRVLQDRGSAPADGTTADVAAGIVWAADHGAQIINLSLSTETRSGLLEDAVRHAAEKGALVIASAGNVQPTARRYPAAFESVIAVGRSEYPTQNTDDDRWVDVVAASVGEFLNARGQWAAARGASVSTAIVSGVAVLGLSMKPGMSATELRTRIMAAAPLASGSFAASTVNAARLVYDLGGTDTVPPVVTRTDLTAGELIPRAGKLVQPMATDDHGIERIEYLIGGKVAGRAERSGASARVRVPEGYDGSVPVVVRAYDYAGNIGEATVVVEADTLKPGGIVISPARGAVVPIIVDVIVESPDDDVVRVSASWRASSYSLTRIPGTNRWQGSMAAPDTGEFQVVFYDASGNVGVIYHPVTVDSQPPTGGVITPKAGARMRGAFTSSVSNLVDTSGVAKAELWANGAFVGTDYSAPFALPVRTGSYSGNVRLVWRVTDRFGQARTMAAHTVVADNAGPALSISKAPKNKAKIKGATKVYVKASDASGIARVELIVNGKVVARDYTAGYLLGFNASKQKKTMKVQVRAYDKLGNVRYTSTRTWYRK